MIIQLTVSIFFIHATTRSIQAFWNLQPWRPENWMMVGDSIANRCWWYGNWMVIYCGLMGLYSDLMDYEWDIPSTPSGYLLHSFWKLPFSSLIYPLKNVMFHSYGSYVSFPEGNREFVRFGMVWGVPNLVLQQLWNEKRCGMRRIIPLSNWSKNTGNSP